MEYNENNVCAESDLGYDKTLQPGDLIKAYGKGYSEFIRFECRGKQKTPLAHFIKQYREDGTPIKTRSVDRCDASYCLRARPHIEQQIIVKQRQIAALQQLIDLQGINE